MSFTVQVVDFNYIIDWGVPVVSYPSTIDIFLHKDNIHVSMGKTTLDYRLCTNPVTGSGKAFYDAICAIRPPPPSHVPDFVNATNLLNPMPVSIPGSVSMTASGSVTVSNFPATQNVTIPPIPNTFSDLRRVRGVVNPPTGTNGVVSIMGPIAHGGANTSRPLIAGRIIGAPVGSLLGGDVATLSGTNAGQQIVKRYCRPLDQWRATGSRMAIGTVQVIASPGPGRARYVCSMQVTRPNTSWNDVILLDSSGNLTSNHLEQDGWFRWVFDPPLKAADNSAISLQLGNTNAALNYYNVQGFTV